MKQKKLNSSVDHECPKGGFGIFEQGLWLLFNVMNSILNSTVHSDRAVSDESLR
jgi:hypothetical protein